MQTVTTGPERHSAEVRILLHVNGRVLSVAQLGPQFLILRDARDHPPCDAEIALLIDGHKKQWTVHLPEGIQIGRRKTAISCCGDRNAATLPTNQPER